VRLIEIVSNEGHSATLEGIAEQFQVTDSWWGAVAEDGRVACRMLVADDKRQGVMDALQAALGNTDDARIVVLSVDAVFPREDSTDQAQANKGVSATREELYAEVEKGARADSNFLLLVFLSTIVAAVGLIEDNVAAVIGAMVIAPLLGPNIALALATALGDLSLAVQSMKTNLLGLLLAFVTALTIGILWPSDLGSQELMARTEINLAGIALALASGAAAVLSLTTGLSSTLVGVMVAVALLPPTAAFGILVGSGQDALAWGAAFLLLANVVCVALAANLVFFLKGIRPRTWISRRKAKQSWTVFVALWSMIFAFVLVFVWLQQMR
jgi:uncharacterized hydrophobic protein (TIGR00341 family)